MNKQHYHNPVAVVNSSDWHESLQISQKKLGIKNPLVITSKGGRSRLKATRLFQSGTEFFDIVSYPTFESCQNAVDVCAHVKCDGVIAIGGGSVMDTAKCVLASLGTGLTAIRELIEFSEPFQHHLPSIFVPTTHGTGSEVTMWGTVWNTEEKKKYSISHPALYPDIAILDGHLAVSLPLEVSLTTVLDALSHGFEALWNKHSNPTSTGYAVDAIVTILRTVDRLKTNPEDADLRRTVLVASNKAGLAFSNTQTAAAHSISYPLTLNFGIPHGIACSMPLTPLMDINLPEIGEEMKEITGQLRIGGVADLRELILTIPEGVLKFNLRDWGVSRSHLNRLIDQSFTNGRMDNNIVNLSKESVARVLESIY